MSEACEEVQVEVKTCEGQLRCHMNLVRRTHHVLSVAGVALDYHAGGLKGGVGDLCHRQLLVVGLLGRDDGCVGGQHEVDTGVGHQVGLELSHIHVQGTIEPQGGGQGGDDLGDQAVQVGVGGTCAFGREKQC